MARWIHTLLVAAALIGAGVGPMTARAQAGLESAKEAGLIGERPDGLLGVVSSDAPGDVRSLVDRINDQRMERYRSIARSNGTSVDKVQAVAGTELIQRTPSGQYIMNTAGRWVRK